MHTSLKTVVEPVYRIVHTDREVEIEWREEIRINLFVITLHTMRKLSLGYELQSVVPALGGLQTNLAGITNQVFCGFVLVNSIATRCLITKTQFQLVVPLHLLLVVVVGLHGYTTQERIVTLASLIPVVRHIVLQELKIIVAPESPEVRLRHQNIHRSHSRLNSHWCDLFNNICSNMTWSRFRDNRCTHTLKVTFVHSHQVGTIQIHMHQSLVDSRLQRIGNNTLPRSKPQKAGSRFMIKSKRNKELRITTIDLGLHQRVNTLSACSQRVHIFCHPVFLYLFLTVSTPLCTHHSCHTKGQH